MKDYGSYIDKIDITNLEPVFALSYQLHKAILRAPLQNVQWTVSIVFAHTTARFPYNRQARPKVMNKLQNHTLATLAHTTCRASPHPLLPPRGDAVPWPRRAPICGSRRWLCFLPNYLSW